MLKAQVILLILFGVITLAWGARLDIMNHRREKEARRAQSDAPP
jgi:hypothetical protein